MNVGGACMMHPANGRRLWCRRRLLRYVASLSETKSLKHRLSLRDSGETETCGSYCPAVPACLAGVRAGCVHLCRVAANTVIPYGR